MAEYALLPSVSGISEGDWARLKKELPTVLRKKRGPAASGWWSFQEWHTLDPWEDGGVIFMRKGRRVRALTKRRYKDATTWLDVCHAAGYVHTDVRLPNMVVFNGRLQLIDYGLSAELKDDEHDHGADADRPTSRERSALVNMSAGIRTESVGPRIRKQLKGRMEHSYMTVLKCPGAPVTTTKC